MENLVNIVKEVMPVVSVVAVAWLSYNQYSRNKQTDYKLDKMKEEDLEKRKVLGTNIARVYAELHKLLNTLDVDRVFIIQPHPLKRYDFLSVRFCVQRSGVSDIREVIKNVPISDVVEIVDSFSTSDWAFYNDIHKVSDRHAKALMSMAGSTSVAFFRLQGTDKSWIGTLTVENTSDDPLSEEACLAALSTSSDLIQLLLPPFD